MTKWTVRSTYRASEPYFSTKDGTNCQHSLVEEWTTSDFEKALLILKDFLDVPEAELTNEQVRDDFCIPDMTEEQVVGIVNYFNGRLAIWDYAQKELKDHFEAGALDNIFCYEIPEKYASFDSYRLASAKKDVISKIEVVCKTEK